MLIKRLRYILTICLVCQSIFSFTQNNSVLAQGDWYKLALTSEGIYKIDPTFVQSMGINPSTIDPRKIRLFGNGGKMLPQVVGMERPIDLLENALYFKGNADASWTSDEYFLFYGQDPDGLYYDEVLGRYVYENNIYSDTSYYFLNIGTENGSRMGDQPNLGSGFPVISHYDHLIYHEIDRLNVLNSGRAWYGERLSATDPEIDFEYPVSNIAPNLEAQFTFHVMGQSYKPASFDFYANNTLLGSVTIDAIPDAVDSPYADKGRDASRHLSISTGLLQPNKIAAKISFNAAEANRSTGYVNNFLINVPLNLAISGNHLFFASKASLNNLFSTFEVSGIVPGTLIWDISDPTVPKIQQYQTAGSKGSFVAQTSTFKRFVAVQGADFPKAKYIKKIANQNLRASAVPDLLLVAPSALMAEANRLAEFRSSKDGLDVQVVELEQVLNEFSGGSLDVSAIRDYAYHLYSKNPSKFKYLLLFGDASFDFKNISGDNAIQLIGYQSRVSLHPVYTYQSDDYFGFLEEGEGEWREGVNTSINHTLDIGVGRIPAKTLTDAINMVDKIIYYETQPSTLGAWRNEVLFVADDGDGNAHQRDAENVSELMELGHSGFNSQKIYLDAFENIQEGNSERIPDATLAINDYLRKGVLIVNYIGHGSEDRWAHESVLTKTTISEWKNKNTLPLFVTATCEFGRHDDPARTSAGEMLLTEKEKGAIALLTTSRPVLSSSNAKVNEAFFENVFKKINGDWPRLGDVIRSTKNESLDRVNNRNFVLLGDPSMRLAYPKSIAQVTKINNSDVASGLSQIKSLETVKIEGIITEANGQFKEDFNGSLVATVFDKNTELATMGNGDNSVMKYKNRNSVLFRGKVEVVNGEFSFEFIVPKNIDYKIGGGKISLYALEENGKEDAGGASIDFLVGGSSHSTIEDVDGPLVDLFMNDSTFRFGGKTGSSATLLAKISDPSGVNISRSTFGHEIKAEINAETEHLLNDFYICQTNTYQSGWLQYPIDKLPTGLNKIELEAWDNLNNVGKGYLEFYVIRDGEIALDRVFNFPNPFTDETEISFEHSRGDEPLQIEISILNGSGQLIKTFDTDWQNTTTQLKGLKWDGTDSFGKKVQNGIYILKLSVRSSLDGAKNELSHKMIVLN